MLLESFRQSAFQEPPRTSQGASQGPATNTFQGAFRGFSEAPRSFIALPQALFLGLFACPLSEPCLGFQRQDQATLKMFRWLTKMDLTEFRS